MGVASEIIALAQGGMPDFRDVSFPVEPDVSQDTKLLQQDPDMSELSFGEDAQREMAAMPPLAQVQCKVYLSAAGDCVRRKDYQGATAHLERCKAVARRFAEKHLRQEIDNRIQEVSDCANGTHEADYAERHVNRESEQSSPAVEVPGMNAKLTVPSENAMALRRVESAAVRLTGGF